MPPPIDTIVPIRAFTADEAFESLRSKPGGMTNESGEVLAAQWGQSSEWVSRQVGTWKRQGKLRTKGRGRNRRIIVLGIVNGGASSFDAHPRGDGRGKARRELDHNARGDLDAAVRR